MNIDEEVKRACEEPTLAKAVAHICIMEFDRASKAMFDSSSQYETCFEHCIKLVMENYNKRKEKIYSASEIADLMLFVANKSKELYGQVKPEHLEVCDWFQKDLL